MMNRQPSVIKTTGIILFTPFAILLQLLNQFLLSPWGLIVPLTLLITLFAVHQIQKTPAQLALYYAERFETCTAEELPQLIEVIQRMEDAGVPGLVKGLTSNREFVFTACRNVLQHNFDRWLESDCREHHLRVFAEALLQTSEQFPPAAQTEALQFVEQIMKIRPAAPISPQSAADRSKTLAHCEKLLSHLDSVRRRRIEQGYSKPLTHLLVGMQTQNEEHVRPGFSPPNKTVAALEQRTHQPMLLASNGQPFVPASARRNDEEALLADGSYNSFSVARADRLAAYHRSQQNRPAAELPSIAGFSPPPVWTADITERFAQEFSADTVVQQPAAEGAVPDIAGEYCHQKSFESGGTFNSDSFLSPQLQNTPLDRVPNLPPAQLMQLLHHPDPAYVETARRTLASRDGFQESHLKLAWRLYHPIPAVRQEIVAILPHTPNVQPSVWLTVLLDDPSNDVRYRTASFLATSNDPVLRRLLIDRGKRDSDERIISLADRLEEFQRGTVRR